MTFCTLILEMSDVIGYCCEKLLFVTIVTIKSVFSNSSGRGWVQPWRRREGSCGGLGTWRGPGHKCRSAGGEGTKVGTVVMLVRMVWSWCVKQKEWWKCEHRHYECEADLWSLLNLCYLLNLSVTNWENIQPREINALCAGATLTEQHL